MLSSRRWRPWAVPAKGPSLSRAISEARVLDVLHSGSTSRAAISRITGLSKPTVSNVVRDLEKIGLIRPGGRSMGSVGRTSTLYEVNPSAGYALGVDIGGTKVRAAVTDAFGEPLAEITEPTHRERAEELLRQTASLLERLLEQSGVDRSAVIAAGISVPGVLHPDTDEITAAYNVPALAQLHPTRDFGAALRMPVVIANDVNLAAAGEQWRGSAVGVPNFVAISIGTGIGLGIVVDGTIHLGARGAAGEIGWLPLRPGPVDFARTVGGELEDQISAPAILARLAASVDIGEETRLRRDSTLQDVFAAAADGDPLAERLVDQEAALVAFVTAAVSAIVDPSLVVLGGGVGANANLLEPVRRHLAQMLPDPPQIVTSTLGDRASLFGAIAVALDALRTRLLGEGHRHMPDGTLGDMHQMADEAPRRRAAVGR